MDTCPIHSISTEDIGVFPCSLVVIVSEWRHVSMLAMFRISSSVRFCCLTNCCMMLKLYRSTHVHFSGNHWDHCLLHIYHSFTGTALVIPSYPMISWDHSLCNTFAPAYISVPSVTPYSIIMGWLNLCTRRL